MVADWHTLAGRLRWAIGRLPPDGRRRGLRLFQRRMEKLDAPGTSLSALQLHLAGKAEPSLRWVSVAARVLDVRAEWLAWGTGQPTAAAEAAREGARVPIETVAEEVFRSELRVDYPAAGPIDHWDLIGEAARAQIWRLWGLMVQREAFGPGGTAVLPPDATTEERDQRERELAERVIRSVLGPAGTLLHVWAPHTNERESYIVCVCEGLIHLLHAERTETQED